MEEIEVFTPDELDAILGGTQQLYPTLHPFVFTLARTGIRLGEAIALEWQDVDLERRIIVVRRTVSARGKRKNVPKNGRARRVDVSRQLAAVLANWKTLQAAEAAPAGQEAPDAVFQSVSGGALNADVFRRAQWVASYGPLGSATGSRTACATRSLVS